jgi:hypothetical protein
VIGGELARKLEDVVERANSSLEVRSHMDRGG